MQKTQKSEKNITFYMKNCKIEAFLMKILVLKRKLAPGTSLHQDFVDFGILRYVGVFCVGLRMIGIHFLLISFIFFRSIVVYLKLSSRLTFFVIFLHFLQKYRCVPKIGFSADISIDIFTDISIDISIDIFIDICIDIFIDICIDISFDILIGICVDILIDILRREEEWRSEGVDLFLKSNNPTPTGGEKRIKK